MAVCIPASQTLARVGKPLWNKTKEKRHRIHAKDLGQRICHLVWLSRCFSEHFSVLTRVRQGTTAGRWSAMKTADTDPGAQRQHASRSPLMLGFSPFTPASPSMALSDKFFKKFLIFFSILHFIFTPTKLSQAEVSRLPGHFQRQASSGSVLVLLFLFQSQSPRRAFR